MIDVIAVLTESDRPRKYWSDLKKKLEKEGSELSEKIGQLKMLAEDGKMRTTDVVDIRKCIFKMVKEKVLDFGGANKNRVYFLAKKR